MKKVAYIILTSLLAIAMLSLLIFSWPFSKYRKTQEKILTQTTKIMKITSPDFENNKEIPSKYTCDGENVNPPLKFEEIPNQAKSLILIVDDPDAPGKTWVHWILFNISPTTEKINENSVPEGALGGITDFGNALYGGPCPPSGTHRYFFKLYALDSNELDLGGAVLKDELERKMQGHIIEQAELIGLYSRN